MLLVAAWIRAGIRRVAEVRFFDMGTADSKLYEGATRVTAADVYSGRPASAGERRGAE
jgi:hypothetical protein